MYQHLQRGAKWFRYRVSIHHPIGFNWHPFEGAGTHLYISDLYTHTHTHTHTHCMRDFVVLFAGSDSYRDFYFLDRT